MEQVFELGAGTRILTQQELKHIGSFSDQELWSLLSGRIPQMAAHQAAQQAAQHSGAVEL